MGRISIIYKDKNKDKDEYNGNFTDDTLNMLFSKIEKNLVSNESFYLVIDRGNEDLHMEFANGCCNIQMDLGEVGYALYNPDESDEYIDLFANSYSRKMLCFSSQQMLEIVKTFVSIGKPDENYQWEEFDM